MPDPLRQYREDGWTVFAHDPALAAWSAACAPVARAMLDDPELAGWYRCDGTWFAGVNALPNDATGAIPGQVPPLSGNAVAFARETLGFGPFAWDAGQISVVFPGYPRHGAEDTDASFRYRRHRYAAHVDGLERSMPERRRKLSETHSFLLGIPLTDAGAEEGAFVVWRGSHEIMRAAFTAVFEGHDPQDWFDIDVTEAYVAARKRCFETCEPVRIAPGIGRAYAVHPLALHGVAPWEAPTTAPRMIAYFRPDAFAGDPVRWLTA